MMEEEDNIKSALKLLENVKKAQKKYREKHREKYNEAQKKYYQNKKDSDPDFLKKRAEQKKLKYKSNEIMINLPDIVE